MKLLTIVSGAFTLGGTMGHNVSAELAISLIMLQAVAATLARRLEEIIRDAEKSQSLHLFSLATPEVQTIRGALYLHELVSKRALETLATYDRHNRTEEPLSPFTMDNLSEGSRLLEIEQQIAQQRALIDEMQAQGTIDDGALDRLVSLEKELRKPKE